MYLSTGLSVYGGFLISLCPYNKYHSSLHYQANKKNRNDTCYMDPSLSSLWETYKVVWTFVFEPFGCIVLPFFVMWTNVETTVDCMIKVIALATAFVQPTKWFCLLFWLLQTHICECWMFLFYFNFVCMYVCFFFSLTSPHKLLVCFPTKNIFYWRHKFSVQCHPL